MFINMYLVPADQIEYPIRRTNSVIHTDKKHVKHYSYEEWVKMRKKMNEADFRKKTDTNAFEDFLRRLMPTSSEPVNKAPLLLFLHLKRRAAGHTRT